MHLRRAEATSAGQSAERASATRVVTVEVDRLVLKSDPPERPAPVWSTGGTAPVRDGLRPHRGHTCHSSAEHPIQLVLHARPRRPLRGDLAPGDSGLVSAPATRAESNRSVRQSIFRPGDGPQPESGAVMAMTRSRVEQPSPERHFLDASPPDSRPATATSRERVARNDTFSTRQPPSPGLPRPSGE